MIDEGDWTSTYIAWLCLIIGVDARSKILTPMLRRHAGTSVEGTS